jgi:zinc transport system permease protein
VVALGMKLVGTLLMGALTIIPAAIARNLTTSMKYYLVLASTLGGMIALVGVLVAAYGIVRPGPTIILLGVALFVVSLLWVKQ